MLNKHDISNFKNIFKTFNKNLHIGLYDLYLKWIFLTFVGSFWAGGAFLVFGVDG